MRIKLRLLPTIKGILLTSLSLIHFADSFSTPVLPDTHPGISPTQKASFRYFALYAQKPHNLLRKFGCLPFIQRPIK